MNKKKLIIFSSETRPFFLCGSQKTNELFVFKRLFGLFGLHFYIKELIAGVGDYFEIIKITPENEEISFNAELINVNALGLRVKIGKNEYFYNNGFLNLIGTFEK